MLSDYLILCPFDPMIDADEGTSGCCNMMKAYDLHIHSKYSIDCLTPPKEILRQAHRLGLAGVAITDHDTVKGGLETKKANDWKDLEVIVGVEVNTDAGHLVGLFVHEEVKAKHWRDFMHQVHAQGGIVVLPHPFRSHRLSDDLVRAVDAVETMNGRTWASANRSALELARKFDKPTVGGSDAHFHREVGSCVTMADGHDLKKAILAGKVSTKGTHAPAYRESVTQGIAHLKRHEYKKVPKFVGQAFYRMIMREDEREG